MLFVFYPASSTLYCTSINKYIKIALINSFYVGSQLNGIV